MCSLFISFIMSTCIECNKCLATLVERGEQFTRGPSPHHNQHDGLMAVAEEAKLRPKMKSTAKGKKTISAMYQVESQILSQGPLGYIPNPTTL